MWEDVFDAKLIDISKARVKQVVNVLEENWDLFENYKFKELFNIIKKEEESSLTQLTHILEYVLEQGTGLPTEEIFKYLEDSVPEGCCYCRKDIKKITLPDNIKVIEPNVFMNCENLSEIILNPSLKIIGGGSFYNSGIKSLTIPAYVKNIGANAFDSCTDLVDVDIDEFADSSIYLTIGREAFVGCTSLVKVILPYRVSEIMQDAFKGCPIEEATIPTWASPEVNNSDLKEVNFIGGTDIPGSSFVKSKALEYIELPEGIESIGENAFAFGGLKSIIIPKSIDKIDVKAFNNCINLHDIYYNGTKEEWEYLMNERFDVDWDKSTPDKKRIHCTDETFILEY